MSLLKSTGSATGDCGRDDGRITEPECWDIPAVDADEEPQLEWEAEDDVKGGPLNPREAKNAREKEIKYLWDVEVYENSSGSTGVNRTQPSWPQMGRYQQRKRRRPTLPCASGVNRSSRQHLLCKLFGFFSVWRVRKTCFELRTLS